MVRIKNFAAFWWGKMFQIIRRSSICWTTMILNINQQSFLYMIEWKKFRTLSFVVAIPSKIGSKVVESYDIWIDVTLSSPLNLINNVMLPKTSKQTKKSYTKTNKILFKHPFYLIPIFQIQMKKFLSCIIYSIIRYEKQLVKKDSKTMS